MPDVIQTHNLARRYGRTEALHPLDLSIPQGAIYALLGPNGAGKTTLIKLLMNILRPTSGSATVLNTAATDLEGDSFIRIGYVSENQDLPGWMTVGAFLKYQSGFYPHWDDSALIQLFDLPLNRKLKHLSRGQRMKAALAGILAFGPQLIVLDEPFSGLDPLVRDELIEALQRAVAARPTTILLSSHDMAETESFATHVAFLHSGRLLFAEEMPKLSARFRAVAVTLAEPPASPAATPLTWLQPQLTGTIVRFIHTQADNEPIEQQVREAFPTATSIDIQPMNLRSIFLAVAKSGRTVPTAAGGRA